MTFKSANATSGTSSLLSLRVRTLDENGSFVIFAFTIYIGDTGDIGARTGSQAKALIECLLFFFDCSKVPNSNRAIGATGHANIFLDLKAFYRT
jgi:hypothetical protein